MTGSAVAGARGRLPYGAGLLWRPWQAHEFPGAVMAAMSRRRSRELRSAVGAVDRAVRVRGGRTWSLAVCGRSGRRPLQAATSG